MDHAPVQELHLFESQALQNLLCLVAPEAQLAKGDIELIP
jgi:hypothetical protein